MRSENIVMFLVLHMLGLSRTSAASVPWKPVNLQELLCNTSRTVSVKFTASDFPTTSLYRPHVVSFMRSERSQVIVEYGVIDLPVGVPFTPYKSFTLPAITSRRLDERPAFKTSNAAGQPDVGIGNAPDNNIFDVTDESDADIAGDGIHNEPPNAIRADEASNGPSPRRLAGRRRRGS